MNLSWLAFSFKVIPIVHFFLKFVKPPLSSLTRNSHLNFLSFKDYYFIVGGQ